MRRTAAFFGCKFGFVLTSYPKRGYNKSNEADLIQIFHLLGKIKPNHEKRDAA